MIATDIDAAALATLAPHVAQTHRLDVTDARAVNALAEQVGGVDILFTCTGYVHQGTILDCEPADFAFSTALNR